MADGVERSTMDRDERAGTLFAPALLEREGVEKGERFDIDAWRSRVTDRLLILVAVAGAVVLTSSVLQAMNEPEWWSQTVPFVAVYAFLLALVLLRGRLSYRIRAWGMLLVGYAAAIMYLAILGLLGNGVVFLLALPALGLIILGIRSGMAMALASLVVYLLFTAAAATGVMADWLIITENTLDVGQWLSQGLSFGLLLVGLVAMLSMLNHAQGQALEQARETTAELEAAHDELAASAGELDRYTQLLEAVAGISHEISGVLTRDQLLLRAVDLMATRLGLRGVAVYLVEAASGTLVPGPAVGEARAGAAAASDVPQVVADAFASFGGALAHTTRERAMRDQTGDREAARGEVVLPLHVGTQLLGVLHVIAPRERPLTDREVQSLHVMADQLAVALDNARLFGEVQARLEELNLLQRQYTTEAWAGFVADRPRPEYLWQPTGKPGDVVWHEVLDRVRARERPETGAPEDGTEKGPVTGYDEETHQHVVAVPVRLREAVIGVLAFHRPRDAGPWQREEIAAIEAVGARLAFAAENLRLLEQTQRRAARERLVDNITRQMQASLDPETILRVAVREVGRALGASQSLVELRGPGGNDGTTEG